MAPCAQSASHLLNDRAVVVAWAVVGASKKSRAVAARGVNPLIMSDTQMQFQLVSKSVAGLCLRLNPVKPDK